MWRRVLNTAQSHLGRTARTDRRWLQDVRSLTRELPGSHVLDIGAHTGSITTRLSRLFPHSTVHAFEPTRASFELLQRRTSRLQNVVAHHLAVSDSDGVASLAARGVSQTNRLVDDLHPGADAADIESTRRRSLDSLVQEFNISEVSFCKIDTEGHELSVLRGSAQLLQRSAIDLLLVEATFNLRGAPHVDLLDILSLMRNYSYQVLGVYSYGRGRFIRGVAYCNVLFGRPI